MKQRILILILMMLVAVALFFLGIPILVGFFLFGATEDFHTSGPGEYSIWRTSAHQIMVVPQSYNDSTPIIPTKVIECDFDSRFVIAKQQELKRRSLNTNDTYMEPAPDKYHYWILDTKSPKAYGPLTFEQFNAQRKSLGVPEHLSLKDVYSFRKEPVHQ